MNYRMDKYGNKLSILGFGCMRFQKKQGKIDFDEAEREILTAFRGGVNYYDTAYIYPGSEALIGEVFRKNGIRDQVHIATKLPHYLIKNREGIERLFQEELKRLQTDYVDYYLMHMLNDVDTWNRLKKLGIEDWIREKKESGAIRQIGFSYHGNSEMFCALVDAYDWDFCQIQYNYLDEHSQAGRRGLHHAAAKGIPVIIMEPLRGGKLVKMLPEDAKKAMEGHPIRRTAAEWGFRWLWNQPEVTVVLSGMNTEAMVKENLKTASQVQIGELTAQDHAMLAQVVKAINGKIRFHAQAAATACPAPRAWIFPAPLQPGTDIIPKANSAVSGSI